MAQLMVRARGSNIAAMQTAWPQRLDRYHWAVATVAYTAITLVLLFPLVAHLGSRSLVTPMVTDNGWEVWYLWWFRTAINTGRDPAYTHTMYALLPSITLFPAGYYDGAVGYLLQWASLTPVAAYNVLIVLGFILTGLTTYLLAGALVESRVACFIAGFLFSFSTYHFTRATGHLTLATMQWLPLCAWRTFAFYRRPTLLNAVWLGLSIALLAFTEIYYVAYFLLPFGLLFVAGKLVSDFAWFRQWRHWALIGLALGLAAALTIPPLRSFLSVDPATRQLLQGYAQGGLNQYSANFLAYVLPFPQNLIVGHLTAPIYRSMHGNTFIEEDAFPGYVTLALACSAPFFRRNRQRRSTWFWLVAGISGVILSLGPALYVGGQRTIPLPFYTLLYGLPVLSAFRAPNRISPLALLSFALLAAYAIDAIDMRFVFDRLTRVAMMYLCVVAMGASLMEHATLSVPLPTSPVVVPAFYQQIAADPDPNALVLDVPLTNRGSDEFYQTIHHKRLVGGYAIRMTIAEQLSVESVPDLTFFEDMPDPNAHYAGMPGGFAGALAAGDIYPIGETFAQALLSDDIKYVVLHRQGTPPKLYAPLRQFLLQQLGTPMFDNTPTTGSPFKPGSGGMEPLMAWRVAPSSAAPRIDRFRLGDGWIPGLRVMGSHLERAVQQDAYLSIVAPATGMQRISFQAEAYFRPLTLVVSLNGQTLGTFHLSQPWTLRSIDLGTPTLRQGTNTLLLHVVEGCSQPRKYEPTDQDPRCFSVGMQQLAVAPLVPPGA